MHDYFTFLSLQFKSKVKPDGVLNRQNYQQKNQPILINRVLYIGLHDLHKYQQKNKPNIVRVSDVVNTWRSFNNMMWKCYVKRVSKWYGL